jgi:hypothetical protein
MTTMKIPVLSGSHDTNPPSQSLLRQYGCGPIQFTEADHGLYDRHLLFDNVMPLDAAGPRERFEAFARSVLYLPVCSSCA